MGRFDKTVFHRRCKPSYEQKEQRKPMLPTWEQMASSRSQHQSGKQKYQSEILLM